MGQPAAATQGNHRCAEGACCPRVFLVLRAHAAGQQVGHLCALLPLSLALFTPLRSTSIL